jgi:hypothetical protein
MTKSEQFIVDSIKRFEQEEKRLLGFLDNTKSEFIEACAQTYMNEAQRFKWAAEEMGIKHD